MRRQSWLLLLLFFAVALYTYRDGADPPRFEPRLELNRPVPETPQPVRATGDLGNAYLEARRAAVRVESRCRLPAGHPTAPIDVGSGFFVSPDGQLLTAYHVVRRQSLGAAGCQVDYWAVGQGGAEYRLQLVGFDAISDVALMRAEVEDEVPYLRLAAELPAPGTAVVAIGNSRGEFLGDRAGEVSRLDVSSGRVEFASGTIELTAAVAPGDSGGPVVNADGEAIGVISYISFDPSIMSAGGESGLARLLRRPELPSYASYAVPVLAGSERLAALVAGEANDVPVIGFELAFEYDPADANAPPLGSRPGVVVGRVQPDGPGGLAGLRSYRERTLAGAGGGPATVVEADVIVAVDGSPTVTFQQLLRAVRSKEVGESISLSVQRRDSTVQVELRLAGYRQVFE